MELNDYMEVKNNVIYIRVAPDWEDAKPSKKKVKMSDVISYYARYSGSRGFMASYRTLGEIGGDWRPIDELAEECFEVFKELNIDKLRRLARKEGLYFE